MSTLVLFGYLRDCYWQPFLFYVLSCAGCAVLMLGFKYLIARPRPTIVPPLEKAPFLSFPSGHAAYALVGWGFLAYVIARRPHTLAWRRVGLALGAMIIAGLVGASRIYLAAHYPSDVAGGLLIGVPWLVVILFAFERRAANAPGSVKTGG